MGTALLTGPPPLVTTKPVAWPPPTPVGLGLQQLSWPEKSFSSHTIKIAERCVNDAEPVIAGTTFARNLSPAASVSESVLQSAEPGGTVPPVPCWSLH